MSNFSNKFKKDSLVLLKDDYFGYKAGTCGTIMGTIFYGKNKMYLVEFDKTILQIELLAMREDELLKAP